MTSPSRCPDAEDESELGGGFDLGEPVTAMSFQGHEFFRWKATAVSISRFNAQP
jgi:hypothetical protein